MWFWDNYKPARPHQWDGALADVRAARLDGMAAYGDDKLVKQAGALAGVLVVALLRIFPLSPIRSNNVLIVALFFALYGAWMGNWRKRDLLSNKRYHLFNRDFMAHTLFNYAFMPFLPVVYMMVMPELTTTVSASTDTFTGSLLVILMFFWIGAFFDYLWEGFHNFSLVRISRFNPDLIGRLTLRMWIPMEEKNRAFRLDQVEFDNGNAQIRGWFEDPADLRRKLCLLDFVHSAHIEQQGERPAS